MFIVSKVMPENSSRAGTIAACERSLNRLGIERLDLYLLHWPGRNPLKETLAGFQTLMREGLIDGGDAVASNQVLYNLARRGIEADLLP